MKKTQDAHLSKYAEMGLAAMLPGMVRAHELLGQEIEAVRTRLAALQNGGSAVQTKRKPHSYGAAMTPEERSAEMKRRIHSKMPPAKRQKYSSGYWAKMTPEERSAEMKRRVKVHSQKQRRLVRLEKTA